MKVLVGALALDALTGEPPEVLHPVVWTGRLLTWLEARAPRSECARFVYGVAVAAGFPVVWGVGGRFLDTVAPWWLQAIALKSTFAGRSLRAAAQRVENSLVEGDSERARAGESAYSGPH